MSRFGREVSVGVGATGLLLSVIYSLQLNPTVNSVCTGVVAVGSIICIIVGPTLHKPIPVLPWRLLGAASVIFLKSLTESSEEIEELAHVAA